MFQLPGIVIATIEILLWFLVSLIIRRGSKTLMSMNGFTYYWITFIILTGFWEIIYILDGNLVTQMSNDLLDNHQHVWYNSYNLSYILPWQFSTIFYAEYGAYADREYMNLKDGWSHVIEGSHMFLVSLFLIVAMACARIHGLKSDHYTYTLGGAMFAQFMNSFLYVSEYEIQTRNHHSINYNTPDFPLGTAWSKRPFMYVNFLWMILPVFVSYMHLRRPDTEFNASYYASAMSSDNIWSRCMGRRKKIYSIKSYFNFIKL